jgi:hypothetical protein
LRDNLLGLARLAKAFALPTVVGVLRDQSYGGLMPELAVETRRFKVVARREGAFWRDPASVASVRGCGRRELLIAGIDPDEGLAGLSLGARDQGYLVRAVGDASAGGSPSRERIGVSRLDLAGIEVTSWVAIMAEFSTAAGRKPGPADAALRESLARYHAGAVGRSDSGERGERSGERIGSAR